MGVRESEHLYRLFYSHASNPKCLIFFCRGAFSYVKRVTQKKGKTELAAKFISARGKRKAAALREMELLSELDNERILYFHDAFEKKNVVVLITELYPFIIQREVQSLILSDAELQQKKFLNCRSPKKKKKKEKAPTLLQHHSYIYLLYC